MTNKTSIALLDPYVAANNYYNTIRAQITNDLGPNVTKTIEAVLAGFVQALVDNNAIILFPQTIEDRQDEQVIKEQVREEVLPEIAAEQQITDGGTEDVSDDEFEQIEQQLEETAPEDTMPEPAAVRNVQQAAQQYRQDIQFNKEPTQRVSNEHASAPNQFRGQPVKPAQIVSPRPSAQPQNAIAQPTRAPQAVSTKPVPKKNFFDMIKNKQ